MDGLIAECTVAEGEFDGEDFCVYPTDADTEPGVVFEGATKLPLCSLESGREAPPLEPARQLFLILLETAN